MCGETNLLGSVALPWERLSTIHANANANANAAGGAGSDNQIRAVAHGMRPERPRSESCTRTPTHTAKGGNGATAKIGSEACGERSRGRLQFLKKTRQQRSRTKKFTGTVRA